MLILSSPIFYIFVKSITTHTMLTYYQVKKILLSSLCLVISCNSTIATATKENHTLSFNDQNAVIESNPESQQSCERCTSKKKILPCTLLVTLSATIYLSMNLSWVRKLNLDYVTEYALNENNFLYPNYSITPLSRYFRNETPPSLSTLENIAYCKPLSVLYLVQGESILRLPDWYKLRYEEQDLIFLYYNKKIYTEETKNESYAKLVNSSNISIIKAFNSTSSEGKNKLLNYAHQHELNISKKSKGAPCKYTYWAMLDHDLHCHRGYFPNSDPLEMFRLSSNEECKKQLFVDFYQTLGTYLPPFVIPIRVVKKNPKDQNSTYRPIYEIPRGMRYAEIKNWDPMMEWIHREVLDNSLLFPYTETFDEESWHIAGVLQQVKYNLVYGDEVTIVDVHIAMYNEKHTNHPGRFKKPYRDNCIREEVTKWCQNRTINKIPSKYCNGSGIEVLFQTNFPKKFTYTPFKKRCPYQNKIFQAYPESNRSCPL